jgi:hypothetical protein
MRTEPPVSVPIAITAPPSLTDTAAPDDDPPGISRRSYHAQDVRFLHDHEVLAAQPERIGDGMKFLAP